METPTLQIAEENLFKFISDGRLKIYNEHIDAENINQVIRQKKYLETDRIALY